MNMNALFTGVKNSMQLTRNVPNLIRRFQQQRNGVHPAMEKKIFFLFCFSITDRRRHMSRNVLGDVEKPKSTYDRVTPRVCIRASIKKKPNSTMY